MDHLLKKKERIQKFNETGDTSYIYKNELDKACFQHDMAYGDFKDLPKRTAADKVLSDTAFKIASDQKYDGYQRGLASMVYTFFDKKSQVKGLANNKENVQLANELQKPIIKKFNKRKVYSSFKDNIWGVDNKGFRFLLCVVDIFSKYARVIPLKDKKGRSIVNALQIILKKSNCKANKIWVDKGSEFCNSSFKKWLKDNIEMYSTNNEGKSVIAERFIRTLKNKIYKYMTSISKNVYIDKLDDIVKKYNNTSHTSIKMKPVDVKDNTYIGFKKEVNDKNHKFGDHVKISNTKIFLLKSICQIGQKKYLLIRKLKILDHGHMFFMTLLVKKLLVPFMKMNCKRLIKKSLE